MNIKSVKTVEYVYISYHGDRSVSGFHTLCLLPLRNAAAGAAVRSSW